LSTQELEGDSSESVDGSGSGSVVAEEGGVERKSEGDEGVGGRRGGASARMVHDYLGDRYYRDEERVEIRGEVLKEMEERSVHCCSVLQRVAAGVVRGGG